MTNTESIKWSYTKPRKMMNVRATIYAVSTRRPRVDDDEWFEYKIALEDEAGRVVDKWDSMAECYIPNRGQRLTKSKAESAVAEIREDVENGNSDAWFDLAVPN